MNSPTKILFCILTMWTAGCGGGGGGSSSSVSPPVAPTAPPVLLRAIYTTTNSTSGNAVVAFLPRPGAAPVLLGAYGTGANGTSNHATPSADAIRISDDHQFLFVVNTGSDSISTFRINAGYDLSAVATANSGGRFPNNIAVRGTTLFVTNAGDAAAGIAPSVVGFQISPDGHLTANGPAQPLLGPATALPSDALLASNGDLIVPALNSRTISIYSVNATGTVGPPASFLSSGRQPFGSKVVGPVVLISEAAGSLSSYLYAPGALTPISSAVPNGGGAPCWLAVTPNGRYAYVADTAAGTISSFTIAAGGTLTLLNAKAASVPGSVPLDIAVSGDGSQLFQLDGSGALETFAASSDGSLSLEGIQSSGIPATSQGLALLYY